MHKGWKLRRVATVEFASKYHSIAVATCGHVVVRLGHLSAGQRVFCGKCADAR